MNPPDVHGYEFDWFATDRDHHLGVFSTAGSGAAPRTALANPEQQDESAARILALPEIGDARETGTASGNVTDWIDFARRGFYAYDSDLHGGPFRLIVVPHRPLLLSELPTSILGILRLPRFDEFCFQSQPTIDAAVVTSL